MILKGSFPMSMGWKEGNSGDTNLTDISLLDIENLDLVSPMLLTFVKLIDLERIGLWTRVFDLGGKDSGSMSKIGTGIYLCTK